MTDNNERITDTAIKALTGALEEFNNDNFTNCLAALPESFKLHDIQKYQPIRRRFTGSYKSQHIPSWVEYVLSTKTTETSNAHVFVDQDQLAATAVLNFGDEATPGHADHTAELWLKKTADFKDLLSASGSSFKQQAFAEWVEEHRHLLATTAEDGSMISAAQLVARIRKITTRAKVEAESNVGNFSASTSKLASIEINGGDNALPAQLAYNCILYNGLEQRSFNLRLSVTFNDADKPIFTLRLIQHEQNIEAMAEEFASIIQRELKGTATVLLGGFTI